MCLESEAEYSFSAGFECYRFLHNALPELDLQEVSTKTQFLGKEVSFPFVFEAMTGGCEKGGHLNKLLAEVAEEERVAFGLGSQRAMLEHRELKDTFFVRDVAPSIPIIANIGAPQLRELSKEEVEWLVSSVEADALAIHLNALQEAIQPEGQACYRGVLAQIAKVVDWLDVPVIVKETGAGISADVAERLKSAGVAWVDVAGAGGTSWSKIEYRRNPAAVPGFEDWGIPTALAVEMVSPILPTIASGGIRSGIDGAKALCLGAKMFGAARPFLVAAEKNRAEVQRLVRLWREQLRLVQFLLGVKEVTGLKKEHLLRLDSNDRLFSPSY